MSEAELTVDEIISTLRHSTLPTVLVEGRDDMSVFGYIEENFDDDVSVMQCGGVKKLLAVYDRRDEFDGLAVVFLADRDMKLFENEAKLNSDRFVYTTGYSLENDIIAGSNVMSFYSSDDIDHYNAIRHELSKWWAYVVCEYKAGNHCCLSHKIRRLLKNIDDQPTLKKEIIVESDGSSYREPHPDDVKAIENDFELLMRGHQLADLHSYLLGKKGGEYKSLANCLFLVLLKNSPSPYMKRLVRELKKGMKGC